MYLYVRGFPFWVLRNAFRLIIQERNLFARSSCLSFTHQISLSRPLSPVLRMRIDCHRSHRLYMKPENKIDAKYRIRWNTVKNSGNRQLPNEVRVYNNKNCCQVVKININPLLPMFFFCIFSAHVVGAV